MRPAVSLHQKIFFLIVCLLMATNLIIISFKESTNTLAVDFKNSIIKKYVDKINLGVSDSFQAFSYAATWTTKFRPTATGVSTFLKPSNATLVSEVIPEPAVTAPAKPAPAAASPVASAPPPAAPAASLASPPPAQSPAPTVDLYAWGNCTWWAAMRRSQVGQPIPNSWGNAASWAYRAIRDGYVVDHHPAPGAIMQLAGTDYGLGHVAFVEGVDPDGTWHISEMNVLGLDLIDNKTEPPAAAANFYFIHGKG